MNAAAPRPRGEPRAAAPLPTGPQGIWYAPRRMSRTTRLLEEARGGDKSAREALFGRHRGRLSTFLRVTMSAALARRVPPEDILQETLLEAARKLDGFEHQGTGSFYRWLVGIARFKASEAQRAQGARKRALETPLEEDPLHDRTGVSSVAARAERADLLREALERLPAAQGAAIRLRYLEGRSTRETAEALEKTEAAVKMLVSRAFATLATHLSPPG